MNNLEYRSYLLEAIEEHILFQGRRESSSTTEELHVGYGIDENYARCMGASITSICLNNPNQNFVFHILASGLKEESQSKIKELADNFNINIHVYCINNDVFKKLPTQVHLPLSTYYRFILPVLLSVPRILYLDADIICLGNIQQVFTADMDSKVVLSVPDLEHLSNKRTHELGLNDHIYFNAGMLLIDINKWNDHQVADKVIGALLKEPKKFKYLDQDALNLVLAGKVKHLGKEWNRINAPDMIDDGVVLLHFAAHPKPWSIAWAKSDLCNEFTRDIYSKYEKLSPWKNSSPTAPRNYKEMRSYAQCLLKAGDYREGFYWYGQYLQTKTKIKLCARNSV